MPPQHCRTTAAPDRPVSKRQEIKALLRTLRRDSPNIEKSIFSAIHSVALDTFPGYKTHGE